MALKGKERYSAEKIDKLYDYLKRYHELSQPIDYEILVDGFRAVRRTNDPEAFYNFDMFVTANTDHIEIVFYQGNSNNTERFLYVLTDAPIAKLPMEDQNLSGIEIQSRIQDGISKERERWEAEKLMDKYNQLEKDNSDYENWIKELEEDKQNLEDELEKLKAGANPLNSLLGEIGSSFVTGFIKKNPGILKALPMGEALSGFLNDQEEKHPDATEEQESTVEIKAKKEELSVQDKEAMVFIRGLQQVFSQEEFMKVMQVIDGMASDKSRIEVVLQLLNQKENAAL